MKYPIHIIAFLSLSAPLVPAAVFIQELFDNVSSGNASLNGAGDTATSIGMTATWATNGSTGIFTANNFNVNGTTLPGLPSNAGANGGVWNNTNSYNTGIHATRPLTTTIDFNAERVIYFSVRLNNPGDTSMGIGLAAGAGGSAEFVGAGFSWNNAVAIDTGLLDSGNAAYISHGTLDASNGTYGIRAHEPMNSVNTFGLLVGRLTTRSSGADLIDIRRYAQNETIDDNLGTISWSASSSVDSSMTASHLLLWMNGVNSGELDAIRFGDSWTDVTGVVLVPEPSAALLLGLGGIAVLGRRRRKDPATPSTGSSAF